MRKLHVAAFVSMDGVMQAPGGPEEDPSGGFPFGGWVAPHFDETVGAFVDTFIQSDYDLLLGRKTYEIFAGHWPHQDDEIGRKFRQIAKYVVAGPQTPLDWEGSVRLDGDPAQAVAELKRTDGPDLLTQGSSELIQTLMAAGLVDRISTLMFPVVLGVGKPLFGGGAAAHSFTLNHSAISPSGVVMATYDLSGDVDTGSFAAEPPSPEELARRDRLARED